MTIMQGIVEGGRKWSRQRQNMVRRHQIVDNAGTGGGCLILLLLGAPPPLRRLKQSSD